MAGKSLRSGGSGTLTRISVTGAGDFYVVRRGDEGPVRVWSGRDGLTCECGQSRCAHVTSLELCGFVEIPYADSRAA